MRLAYADPPYPGLAKLYEGHPDFGGEVDHAALVGRLGGYDGWALSTAASTLPAVLALCPRAVRVAAWVKTNTAPPGNRGAWWWSWEPVIVQPARRPREVTRDVFTQHIANGFYRGAIIGAKPAAVCAWIFRLLGAEPDDVLDDLYPGSGAVGAEWERWRAQGTLFAAGVGPVHVQLEHDAL